jgi:hypothetical protein
MAKTAKKTRAKRKTVQQMLDETQAKERKLKARIALKKVMDNPAIKTLQNSLDELTKKTIEFQKGFGSGPQSFRSRIEGKQLWIAQIEAEAEFAEVGLDALSEQRDYLKTEIGHVATAITEGITGVELDHLVSVVLSNIPTIDDENVAGARANLEAATTDRLVFTKLKKMSKKAKEAINNA